LARSSIRPDSPVDALPGIGPARAKDLAERGIESVADLLRMFPREYILPSDRCRISELREGEPAVLDVHLRSVRLRRRGWRSSVVEAELADQSGAVRALWFRVPYLAKTLAPGSRLLVHGTLSGKPPALLHPRFEVIREETESEFDRIVPRYPTIPRLPPRTLRKAIRHALEVIGDPDDPLSSDLLERLRFPPLGCALRAVHRPDSIDEAARARRRFIFEELYALQSIFADSRRHRDARSSPHPAGDEGPIYRAFLDSLPFTLTPGQTRAMDEIAADLRFDSPMERLLVGDVGSGKTVVAAAAITRVVGNGGQAALLVPTDVLARQHHRRLERDFAPLGVEVTLLTGDLPAAESRHVRERAAAGETALVVGTHALLQESTRFKNLALAVVDEQHRFGVRQRALLPAKGDRPHFLLLSATPIPRSLALTLYGDLDLTVIDDLPPGRLPVHTRHVRDRSNDEAYRLLGERLEAGEQGFVLFPLVEESESSDRRAATEAADRLARGRFRDRSVALLHGRLAPAERIETLDRLHRGDVDVLVSTTVVEVGIDLPRATVMIVEHADRFGLSQLHQIRGRVGRSDLPSHCFLVTHGPITPRAEERLAALEKESDGFRIAEEDLRLRGTGDLLGERQHGRPGFGIADLLRDKELLEIARREAFARPGSVGSRRSLRAG